MSREQFDKQTQLPTEFCEATVDYRRDHDIPSNLSLTRNRDTASRELSLENKDEKMDEESDRFLTKQRPEATGIVDR